MPAPAPTPTAYTGLPGRFDEAVDAAGQPRPAWAQFWQTLGADPLATLRAAGEQARRAILEQDVSLNVYSGEGFAAATWPLDPVPQVYAERDWQVLAEGLRQRAQLFNALLQDLYGPQRLLHSGALPAALAMANPHFLRACVGLGRARQPFVHLYAADVARAPDGRWWVLQDRMDAPSGLGYALQNRILVRQALPQSFNHAPVRRLYGFARDYRQSLDRLHPRAESPRLVLLSPGPANESYYEHAYLARHLGCPLVEGGDLVTRDRQVFLRTVGGLRKVDVLLRRVDSDFCDPLELEPNSLLGVPGLVHAAHSGRVALSNQLGARALESPALLAFLEPLCRQMMGEDLILPNAATWWAGQAPARDYVLERLGELVIKPAFGGAARYGAQLSAAERAKLAAEIRARPGRFCGQERVLLGTTPAWDAARDGLRPMPCVTRVYLVWHEGNYLVMPGGLTRFNPNGEDTLVSLQSGSVSKDTWVLAAESQADTPALTIALASPGIASRHGAATPSRLADNLFWLGRYLERTAKLARLLDKVETLRRDEVAGLNQAVARDAARFALELQDVAATPQATLEALITAAQQTAANRGHHGGLATNLGRLSRNLEMAKVRLPPEAWHIARQLRTLAQSSGPLPVPDLREPLATLDGIMSESLMHDTGWRFLELGRRLERATHILQLLLAILGRPRPTPPGEEDSKGAAPSPKDLGLDLQGEYRLQTCLHFADSLFTFRASYHGSFQPATVLAWLVAEAENPRALRFQAERIAEHLAALPDELAPEAVEHLRNTAFRLLSAARLQSPTSREAVAGFVRDQLALIADLNARLTQIYFTHAEAEA